MAGGVTIPGNSTIQGLCNFISFNTNNKQGNKHSSFYFLRRLKEMKPREVSCPTSEHTAHQKRYKQNLNAAYLNIKCQSSCPGVNRFNCFSASNSKSPGVSQWPWSVTDALACHSGLSYGFSLFSFISAFFSLGPALKLADIPLVSVLCVWMVIHRKVSGSFSC